MSLHVQPDGCPIRGGKYGTKNNPAERHIDRDPKQPDSSRDSFVPELYEGTGRLCLRTPRSPQHPYPAYGRYKYQDADAGRPTCSHPARLMPHEHGKNQEPEERDCRHEIAQHEAPVLAFDPLLDFVLELGWGARNAAPLFAPAIKFAIFSHVRCRFNLPFSFSSTLSRFAWSIFSPPYSFRQLQQNLYMEASCIRTTIRRFASLQGAVCFPTLKACGSGVRDEFPDSKDGFVRRR
jgi:hypothetical protein